jgi:hypothetical protein
MLYAGDADNTLMSAFRNELNQSEDRRRQVAYSLHNLSVIYIFHRFFFSGRMGCGPTDGDQIAQVYSCFSLRPHAAMVTSL